MRNGIVVFSVASLAIAACGGHSGTPPSSPSVAPTTPPPASPPPNHILTVSKSGSGNIKSTPVGIDCGLACSAILAEGTQIVLTPTPDPGWQFAGWGGGCTGLGGCGLRLAADTTVFVTFEAVAPAPPGKHTVVVTPSGSGSGRITSTPTGIDCGATCTAQFDDGAKIVLAATPDSGSIFSGWSGACSGSSTCELTLTADAQAGGAFDAGAPSGWTATVGGSAADANVLSVATDPGGNTIALIVDSSAPEPVGLRKLDAAGTALWTKFFDGSAGDVEQDSVIGTDGSGDIYLLWASSCADFGCRGTIDFGDGATPAAALVKLDPDGKLLWEMRLPEDGAKLAVDSSGNAAIRSWRSTDSSTTQVVRVNADGSPAWTMSSRGLGELGIDSDGNVLVGAFFTPTDPIFGQTFASNGPVVVKLASADGSIAWAERIAEGSLGNITALGADASGAVVAAGPIGGLFDFGGEHFDASASAATMFVFEANGHQRFARALPDATSERLAVDPSGSVSLVGNGDAATATVVSYSLAGTLSSTRTIQAAGTGAALAVNSVAVAADHSTVLGGTLTGTADFGNGPVSSQGHALGYIAKLAH